MPFDNKVIWSEGMFIRAQHFQQDGRYFERFARSLAGGLRGYGYGFTDLKISRELLSIGRFGLERAAGVFEDGTPFALPDSEDLVTPLQLSEGVRNAIVYLTLPITQPGGRDVADASEEVITRFTSSDAELVDATSADPMAVPIRVGKLRLRLALESADRSGHLGLGVARIAEVRADNSVILDDGYIPPLLDTQVSMVLAGLLTEVVGLLNHRGEALASRLASGSVGTAGELSDTLMLQTINRWQPYFAHLSTASRVHPETIYQNLVSLAGEIATFTTAGHRPRAFPVYDHDRLQPTFAPVVTALRQSLSAVLDRGAIPIPLTEHRYGIRVAEVPDKSIYSKYTFVLAAKAAMPADALARRLVGQIKVGPVEQIRELVNAALPAIMLQPLPVAPRQIPYHTGKAYFELDRSNQLWRVVASSSGLAIHVAGDFPGLELDLWAVKD